MHCTLHSASLNTNDAACSQLLMAYGRMEVQTKKQNDLLQLLQAPVRTLRRFKNIKELLITELCIITSDKELQVLELSLHK